MKIYIAGPDVFLPNALEQAKVIKQLCEQYGHIGLFPLDNEVNGWHPHQIAQRIKDANISMIDECDIVIANLSPFRGPEPDSGTAWEVGYAQGLKKRVLAYSSDMRILKEKTQAILGLGNSAHDKEGMEIEDFSLTHNLMYADCVVGNSFEACLKHLNGHMQILSVRGKDIEALMPKWIDIKQALPKISNSKERHWVLACNSIGDVFTATLIQHENSIKWHQFGSDYYDDSDVCFWDVCFWMELPKAPILKP